MESCHIFCLHFLLSWIVEVHLTIIQFRVEPDIERAGGEAEQRVLALRSVAARVTAIRRRNDCVRFRQKGEADNCECGRRD